MQKTLFSIFANFSVPKFTARDTHKTRNHFSPTGNTKKSIVENKFSAKFFRKCLLVPKKVSPRKFTFFQAKISYKSGGVSFDQMKVSGKKTRRYEKTEKEIFRNHQEN